MRGLLIAHEDRFELTRSGVSTFEDVFFSSKGRDQRQEKNDQKYTFFDLRGAASLVNETHPVDECFQGLLIVHEGLFELTRSGVSTFEVVVFSSKGRDQRQVKNDQKNSFLT